MRFLGRSPLATVARGLLAGAAGTAAMTVHQELRSSGGGGCEPDWESAPAPAVVARRLLEGLFDVEVPARRIPLLTNATHWLYGTALGVPYALAAETAPPPPLRAGLAFGASVWAFSYATLVPMGLYEPPWTYSAKTLANDLGYHATYGTATALAHRALA